MIITIPSLRRVGGTDRSQKVTMNRWCAGGNVAMHQKVSTPVQVADTPTHFGDQQTARSNVPRQQRKLKKTI